MEWSATSVVEHTDTDFVVTTKTKLGTDLQSHYLDGHRHVMERMGKAATVAATWAHCKLVIDVQFTDAPSPAMRYVETRRLVEPDVQLQVFRVFKDHRLVHTCSRVWLRSASHDRPATALTPVDNGGAQRSHQDDSAALQQSAQQPATTPTKVATSVQAATATERGGEGATPLAWSQAPPAVRRVYLAIATAALVLAVALVAIVLPSMLYIPAFAVIGVEVLHRRRTATADAAQAATAHGESGGGT